MHPQTHDPCRTRALGSAANRAITLASALGVMLAFSLATASPSAFAGQASLGEPLFYPCTSCHPVTLGPGGLPTKPLPNAMRGHSVVLESHDRLGRGSAACAVCHEDAAKDPGKLKLIDGNLVDITGDVSGVCYRCHERKYKDWQAGTHGKRAEKCTSSGCHDPHTPAYVYAPPLLPFVGTGFQARAVSDRKPFVPLASAPVDPPVETPSWFVLAAALGMTVSAGIVGTLTLGRPKR